MLLDPSSLRPIFATLLAATMVSGCFSKDDDDEDTADPADTGDNHTWIDTGWDCGESDYERIEYKGEKAYEDLAWEDCKAICEGQSHLSFTDCWWYQDEGTIFAECYYGDWCEGRRPAEAAGQTPVRGTTPAGAWWARMAHHEAASVVAFAQLAVDLQAHGAPQALVDRARRAAADEVRHAQAAAALAAQHGATPVRPPVSAHSPGSLYALARLNAVEGCVNETFSALVAAHQALHADSPQVRAALATIATDERAHAELSWDIHAWASAQLSAAQNALLRAEMRGAWQRLEAGFDVQIPAELLALGLPDPTTARGLAAGLHAALAA